MGTLEAIGQAAPAILAIQQDYDQQQQQAITNQRNDAEDKRRAIMFQQQQADYAEKQKQLDMPIPLDTIAQKVGGDYPTFFKGFVELGRQHGVIEDIGGTPVIRQRNLPVLAQQMKFGTEVGNMQIRNMLTDVTNKSRAISQELMTNKKLKPEERQQLEKMKAQLEEDRQHALYSLDPEFQQKMMLQQAKQIGHVVGPNQAYIPPGATEPSYTGPGLPQKPQSQWGPVEKDEKGNMWQTNLTTGAIKELGKSGSSGARPRQAQPEQAFWDQIYNGQISNWGATPEKAKAAADAAVAQRRAMAGGQQQAQGPKLTPEQAKQKLRDLGYEIP